MVVKRSNSTKHILLRTVKLGNVKWSRYCKKLLDWPCPHNEIHLLKLHCKEQGTLKDPESKIQQQIHLQGLLEGGRRIEMNSHYNF